LFDDLIAVESDPRSILVLKTFKTELRSPNLLSDARNEINYDLTSSPFRSDGAWPSLLIDLDSPAAVEDELARSTQTRAERRFEIAALALGCLSAHVRHALKRRGVRLDQRQASVRADLLPNRRWLFVR
jgi:hypothetical protein